VHGKRGNEDHHAGIGPEERSRGRRQEERPADARRPDADEPARARPLDEEDGWNLQQLCEEGDGREEADGKVIGTERDRVSGEEDARRENAHGLVGEGIIEDKPARPLAAAGIRRHGFCGANLLVHLSARRGETPDHSAWGDHPSHPIAHNLTYATNDALLSSSSVGVS
jgi:hypothetical protein